MTNSPPILGPDGRPLPRRPITVEVAGGTPHWRRSHVEQIGIRERATRTDQLRCERIIEAWNKRPSYEWSPAIGTALTAGYRWLSVYSRAAVRSPLSTWNASIACRHRLSNGCRCPVIPGTRW
jgi:hypothetical protein